MSFRIAGAIAMLISSGATAASCMPRNSPRIGNPRRAATSTSIMTTAPAPSDSCEALRAVVAIEGDLLLVTRLGHLVGDAHRGCERNDLLGELAGGRRGGDARLTLQDVRILRLAADAVLLRDEVGGLVHRPPHGGHALLQ